MAEGQSGLGLCSRCGGPLERSGTEATRGDVCGRCQILVGEGRVATPPPPPPPEPVRRSWVRRAAPWVLLAAAVGVMAFQVPEIRHVLQEVQPLREGTYDTDAKADQCIQNLWKLLGQVQAGRRPGGEMVCPLSGRPYLVETRGGATLIRCPNPQEHGLRILQVSTTHPLPEARR